MNARGSERPQQFERAQQGAGDEPKVEINRTQRRSKRFERVRRPADLLLALFALGLIAMVFGLIRTLPIGSTELSSEVTRWLLHIPRWLSSSAEVVAAIGGLALVVVALVVLLRSERRGALNAGAAAGAAALATTASSIAWHAERGSVARAVLNNKNPSTFIVVTTFIAFLVASDLVRRSRWLRWCVLAAAALLLAGLAVNALTPFAMAVALLAALFFGWLVRWFLGAASEQPSTTDIKSWLLSHQVPVHHLESVDHRRHARLNGTLDDGTEIEVRMANRDTRGAGLMRRVWAIVRLRPMVAGHAALSSRSQLEQLALASYLANGAGLLSPSVLLLNEVPPETLVLVIAKPRGETFIGGEDAEGANVLFHALRGLHDAGVAHRDLRPGNLLIGHGAAGFSSLNAALPGAGELVRRLDVTQLLTTLARAVGAPTAVQALRNGYQPNDESAIAAILQPIALAPWGWSAMREARGCISEVRRELVGTNITERITRLERFRWRTVASTVALTIAAFLVIGQLSRINLLGALRHTNFGWFAIAILGSALTYFAAAENLAAFVPKRLSLIRGFFVQLSTAFVGIAMPPTVGHIAVNARYLARQDVDEGSIAAAVAVSQIVNVVTTVLLLITFGLLTGSGISRFKIVPSSDLLTGVATIVALGGILLLVPQTRAKLNHHVLPRLRSFWPRLLDAVSQPLRLAVGTGANLLLTFGYLVAFIAALRALGAHPAIIPAGVVYLAGNAVGSAAPTPGGLGAVEAVLVAGLTAIGIPAHEAIPSVLIFRIATFWLPIPAGWLSFLVLQRRGIL
ncbi:MAG TPA: lysylphosphatidylglycerol synthase transmembrane domain-containing protein [Acidimicrobiales bacterium]|nr:lysylphosphatidylglycerol synthase transmembrane domain-containing protein [Acidimicrobiales bacterium]